MQTRTASLQDLSLDSAQEALRKAAEILRQGGLVVFPTETVYGLGGNAFDPDAAKNIYAAKGRPSDNPLIVHIASPEEAEAFAETSEAYFRLARAFMPGPLTVILPCKKNLPKTVTAGLSTVAVRCPGHPAARALIAEAGVPIAAPSANLSGSPSPTCFSHVWEDMNGRVSMILDGGACEIGVESTIVKIEADGSLLLLRPGAITVEDLQAVCGKVLVADAVLAAMKPGETVLSPGMKYRHYAPKAPVTLLAGSLAKKMEYIARFSGDVVLLCYAEEVTALQERFPQMRQLVLGAENDGKEQAKRLFALLREADKWEPAHIFAPLPEKDGIGMALYNRMIRAAAHNIVSLE